MDNWIINYKLKNGMTGQEIVPGINKIAAFMVFDDIMHNADLEVVEATILKQDVVVE